MTGSWLSGPPSRQPPEGPNGYRGRQLGLPEDGVGSLVSTARRVVALVVDWFIAEGVAMLALSAGGHNVKSAIESGSSVQTWTLLAWMFIGIASVTLFGYTPGQYFLRLRVIRVDADAPVGFVRAVARQVALVFVIPALFTDQDGRGMHDRATGTAVVRAR